MHRPARELTEQYHTYTQTGKTHSYAGKLRITPEKKTASLKRRRGIPVNTKTDRRTCKKKTCQLVPVIIHIEYICNIIVHMLCIIRYALLLPSGAHSAMLTHGR